jgi:2,5-diketo-D-gluconate reductase B
MSREAKFMRDRIVYGTYPLMGPMLAAAVAHAMKGGYRAFDTAQIYGNEGDLGGALRHLATERTDFRVTAKIATPNYNGVKFLPSLRTLTDSQLDYVDPLLLHFPPDSLEMGTALELLTSAQAAGLARAVCVSNFTPAQMRKALQLWNGALAVNQVEFHPLLDGRELRSASVEAGIPLQAYSPLARRAVFPTHPVGNRSQAR